MDWMTVVALLALAALVAAGLTLIFATILRKLTTNLKVVHVVSGFAVPIIVFGSAVLFPPDPHGYIGAMAFFVAALLTPVTLLASAWATREKGQPH